MLGAVQRWQDYLTVRGISGSTRTQYRRAFGRFVFDTLADPLTLTEDDVVAYLAHLTPKAGMRNLMLRSLKSFYAWAEDREVVGRDPTRRLKVKDPRMRPATALDREELCRLVYAAANREPRHAWTIIFLYTTGARLESACAVEPRDIKGDWVHFRVSKGDRPYSVPLNDTAQAAVRALLAYEDATLLGRKPGTVWAWVAAAGREAGLHAHPHLMRHTFATVTMEDTKDPRLVADLLNHADLSQMVRYSHVNDRRRLVGVRAAS